MKLFSSLNIRLLGAGLFFLGAFGAQLAAVTEESLYKPALEAASDRPREAIKTFQFPKPFEVDLFAAEPLMANPVQFYVDNQGRIFLAETYRQGDEGGVVDNRQHMYWLHDDLAAQRVEDRAEMLRRHAPEMIETWTTHHDLIRLLEDTDGDKRADRSEVFASGFNGLLEGTGAGVISRGNKVWYTNIPNLWLLEDEDNDGRADRRESLSYGYGLTVALRGHDLHGLVFGPDGKLYFSLGDRGYNVVTQEGRNLKAAMEGAVFRCNLDGSELEVFATGLRNPQGLAFDNFGNLFTGDNNSDAADKARWVYVVEGGDSGWRMPYQTLKDRGPFGRQELWKPRFPGQPASHIPPLANVTDGPSGLAFNPGGGMPAKYDGYFFLTDFRASPAGSGVWALGNEPDGAGFKLVDRHKFLWNIVATDAKFGPGGSLYVSDWVQGWTGVNRGRIYRMFDPDLVDGEIATRARELLAAGLEDLSVAELVDLLGYPNRRVRQEAQFELARRGEAAIAPFVKTAKQEDRQLARVHAIWGLWQLADDHRETVREPLLSLLADADPEIRAQAAKVLGDKAMKEATDALIALLADPEPRPAYFAAVGLGKIGAPEAIGAVVELLARNDDRDLYLRHAGVMALTGIGEKDDEALIALTDHENRSVRLGVLLAMRRLHHPAVAHFLNDADEFLVAEAASAINDDTVIEEAEPALALTLERTDLQNERVLRRAINANFRLGGLVQAKAVAAFAARNDVPVSMRVEAINALADWHQPGDRDRVTGFWRPMTGRPAIWPITAADAVLGDLLASGNPESVRNAAIALIAQYKISHWSDELLALVQDDGVAPATRLASLRGLDELGNREDLVSAIQTAIASELGDLRTEAYGLLPQLGSGATVAVMESLLESETATVEEQQTAVRTLQELAIPEAEAVLLTWFQKLIEEPDSVRPEIHFELIEAARASDSAAMQAAHERFRKKREGNPDAVRQELLFGGDVELGKELVFNHQAASCQRCHIIAGQGSSNVGPSLVGVGSRLNRNELLESLLDPSAQVTAGFGAAVFEMRGGESVTGSIAKEDASTVTVTTFSGEVRELKRSEIVKQDGPYSAMPPMGGLLSEKELRAIVAYLATQKKKE